MFDTLDTEELRQIEARLTLAERLDAQCQGYLLDCLDEYFAEAHRFAGLGNVGMTRVSASNWWRCRDYILAQTGIDPSAIYAVRTS